ncbi:DNA ligase [Clostridioides difficile]|nr:DNA ligase [Clostridioides difficile]NJK16025.1 DNA ligase [Clostridioides difficile]
MQELLKIKNIFNCLIKTSSRKEKINILEQNKNNGLFVECLQFLLDPNFKTGISKKKLCKKIGYIKCKKMHNIYDVIDYLCENNFGRDIDVKTIQLFLERNKEFENFLIGIATKTTKLGISYKTVNKVMPGLIREKNK